MTETPDKTVAEVNERSSDNCDKETPETCQPDNESREAQNEDVLENAFLPPVSSSFTTLLSGNKEELATEQLEDPTIQEIKERYCTSKPAKQNISFQKEAVVNLALNLPEETEDNLVCLSGEGGSAEQLLKKTEQREQLKESQLSDLIDLIAEFEGCFVDKPGRTDLVEHDIEQTSQEPVR